MHNRKMRALGDQVRTPQNSRHINIHRRRFGDDLVWELKTTSAARTGRCNMFIQIRVRVWAPEAARLQDTSGDNGRENRRRRLTGRTEEQNNRDAHETFASERLPSADPSRRWATPSTSFRMNPKNIDKAASSWTGRARAKDHPTETLLALANVCESRTSP